MARFSLALLYICVVVFCLTSEEDPFLGEDYEANLVEIEPGDSIFYWLFRSRKSKEEDPLVLWLHGGPGGCSELAVFIENGPFKIDQEDLSLKKHPYSWNEIANVLYLDQPFGTGFSSVSKITHYATNEEMVSENLYKFMIKFYELYPEFKGRKLYIAGESYAGHFIPAFAKYLIEKEKSGNSVLHTEHKINLQSILLGNAWVNPSIQYRSYLDFVKELGYLGPTREFIMDYGLAICETMLKYKIPILSFIQCQSNTMIGSGANILRPDFNIYDVRLPCEVPPLCYNFSYMGKFVNQPHIKELLHVENQNWTPLDPGVFLMLLADFTEDKTSDVEFLLNEGVRVFTYSGDKDYMCNVLGSERWTNEVQWKHQDKFRTTDYSPFNMDGQKVAEYKQVENFTFMKVFDAGHFVPHDQPKLSLELFKRFLDHEF